MLSQYALQETHSPEEIEAILSKRAAAGAAEAAAPLAAVPNVEADLLPENAVGAEEAQEPAAAGIDPRGALCAQRRGVAARRLGAHLGPQPFVGAAVGRGAQGDQRGQADERDERATERPHTARQPEGMQDKQARDAARQQHHPR